MKSPWTVAATCFAGILAFLCVFAAAATGQPIDLPPPVIELAPGPAAPAPHAYYPSAARYGSHRPTEPKSLSRTKDRSQVRIELKDGSRIVGTPAGLDELKFKASFGELTIPMKLVDAVRLNQDVNLSRIYYKGDRLTGVVTLGPFKLKTEWGEMTIDPKKIKDYPPKDEAAGHGPMGAVPRFHTPFAVPPGVVEPAPVDDDSKGDRRVRLQLKDGSRIVGTPVGLDDVKLKTGFGDVAIPMKTVLVIRPSRDRKAHCVSFSNGDRLTGEMSQKAIRMKTDWGEVTIERKHILAITTDRVRTVEVADEIVEVGPDGVERRRIVIERIEIPGFDASGAWSPASDPYGAPVPMPVTPIPDPGP